MTRREILGLALGGWLATGAFAADGMNVGSAHYPGATTITLDGKTVNLTLTGAAMRQKLFVNVYAIASYIQTGTSVGSAEELASADVPKRLHLVMQRDVAGRDVAESFRAAIRQNHPEPEFNEEVDALVRMLREGTARKGEEIYLTHAPGVGLHVNVSGKDPFVIKNPGFSKAVWDIYLGRYNVGEAVKKGLTSGL
jgi:chalcone isomerase-like protein